MPEPQAVLAAARRVVVFTGAGISAESGVPTFRGAGGLWQKYRPEQLATPDAFARDPALVWEWYRWRRGLVAQCAPNAAHRALAEWMRRRDGVTLVTQNVDDLHERAGTPELIKLHGSLFLDRCSRCSYATAGDRGTEPERSEGEVGARSRKRSRPTAGQGDGTDTPAAGLPKCPDCAALLRPGVVWFGEMLPPEELAAAFGAAARADACLVIGTSGAVYPAAGIVHAAREAGATVIVVDPGDTEYDTLADIRLTGPAGELVPPLLG